MAWRWKWIAASVVVAGSATAVQAQPVDSSVCFNAALHKKGALVDYDSRAIFGGTSDVISQIEETQDQENFNGYLATEIKVKIRGDFKFRYKYYLSLTETALFSYGSTSKSSTTTIDPPEQFPANLKAGETFSQTVNYKTIFSDGGKSISERKNIVTFKGVESLTTGLGTFAACRFEFKVWEKSKGSSTYKSFRNTYWFAAEAPYRGFLVKADFGGKPKQTNEVIRIRTFDVD